MDSKDGSTESAEAWNLGWWNYRVVRKGEDLAIYSAYYDENGNVRGLSVDPVSPSYDDLAELKTNLELMLDATAEDILPYD